MELFHFSEDPTIERFVPHVPPTNPTQPPSVWAIDAEHAPLYWFPRDCPRVTAWPRPEGGDEERSAFRAALSTTAERVHAIELDWLPVVRTTVIYRYRFDPAPFRPWPEASGQWISDAAVEPVAIEPIDDLLGQHVTAGIELRAVPNLAPIRDLAVTGPWDFSIVRYRNARQR